MIYSASLAWGIFARSGKYTIGAAAMFEGNQGALRETYEQIIAKHRLVC